MEENDKLVEVIEEGRIVKVPEFYAKKENLPILRKPNIREPRTALSLIAPGIPKHIKDHHKRPFIDYLKKPSNWKEKQVTSELVDNFHWLIRIERRRKGLSRKQFAKLLNENEEDIKLIEAGFIPSSDFILINKIQQHLNINLRKDKKDFSQDIQNIMPKPDRTLPVREGWMGGKPSSEEKPDFKKFSDLGFSGSDIEILEDEI
jgi:transcriptional regulator with XRE-family HTH domain